MITTAHEELDAVTRDEVEPILTAWSELIPFERSILVAHRVQGITSGHIGKRIGATDVTDTYVRQCGCDWPIYWPHSEQVIAISDGAEKKIGGWTSMRSLKQLAQILLFPDQGLIWIYLPEEEAHARIEEEATLFLNPERLRALTVRWFEKGERAVGSEKLSPTARAAIQGSPEAIVRGVLTATSISERDKLGGLIKSFGGKLGFSSPVSPTLTFDIAAFQIEKIAALPSVDYVAIRSKHV